MDGGNPGGRGAEGPRRGHHRGLLLRGPGLPTAPEEFRSQAVVADPDVYDRGRRRLDRVLGRAGRRPRLVPAVGHRPASGTSRSPGGSTAGTLNVSYNCLDRHVAAGRGDRVAFHWEGEPGDTRTITYGELLVEVSAFANVLRGPRRRPGRPGGHLHADDPRAGRGHAGLHPDRRRALGGVRRVLVRRPARPDPRRRGPGGGHRRRRLAAGSAGRRSRPTSTPRWPRRPSSSTWSSSAASATTPSTVPPMTAGRDHWWHELMSGEDPAAGGRRADAASPSTWTPRTCSSSSTPRAPRRRPRGSCTPPAAT